MLEKVKMALRITTDAFDGHVPLIHIKQYLTI